MLQAFEQCKDVYLVQQNFSEPPGAVKMYFTFFSGMSAS